MFRIALVVLVVGCGSSSHASHVAVRVLAINDFHGALDTDEAGNVPGVAYLAAEIAARRTATTVVVSAGDLIGGSPIASGLFHDEPSIDVMNEIGLDYNGVGNHEFDEGTAELLRMQNGGCHPVDGCANNEPFTGAKFEFLAANVRDASGHTIFPAYEIRDVGGAKIAFIGMTLEGTPAQTLASAIPELTFGNEVATVSSLVPEIKAAGAQIILVLLHQGGRGSGDPNSCAGLAGPIIDITNAMDSSVTWIASAHTHAAYSCSLAGKLLTSAGAKGEFLTELDLDVDLATQSVTAATALNVPITSNGNADPDVAAIVDHWVSVAAPVADHVIGAITADISATTSFAGETAMGDVISDAMLAGTTAAGAQAALFNPGGVRAGLTFAPSGPETVPGQVRYGEAFAVQPFANNLITLTLSGSDLATALDEWSVQAEPLAVAGLAYTRHASEPPGSQVGVADVTIQGGPLVASQSYRVTVNSIVADAVSTPIIVNATDLVGAGVDLDLLTAYIAASSPLSPPPLGRITAL